MRAVVQRVSRASVSVVADGESHTEITGAIAHGLCVLVGVASDDTERHAAQLADKLWYLRILDDERKVMNLSLADRHARNEPAEILIISQFTLFGDTTKGRRPSWIAAARPEVAEPLVAAVVDRLRVLGATVATGRFRTEMAVELVNDGPVTLIIDLA